MARATPCQVLSVVQRPPEEKKAPVAVKSVRFHETVRSYRTYAIRDLSKEEMSSMWTSSTENKRMRKRELVLSKKMNDSESSKKESLKTLYAIESLEEKKQTIRKVREHTISVLLEQERQWKESRTDTHLLAYFSRSLSKNNRSSARLRAERLAEHNFNNVLSEMAALRRSSHSRPSVTSSASADKQIRAPKRSKSDDFWDVSSSECSMDDSFLGLHN